MEVKVGLVEILAIVMLSRECGLHTRTGTMRLMTAAGTVDTATWIITFQTHVLTLLLAPLVTVLLINLELQDFQEPKEQMRWMVLQDTLGWMQKQQRQESKESQA